MEMCTLGPITFSGSPVRAVSTSILAPISSIPPIDSGPKPRMIAVAPPVMLAIIGTECPLIALVARNSAREKN